MNWPILIASAGITLLIVLDVKNFIVEPWKLKGWYSFFADTWLVGIIAITVYPFFGGKVWCRYWCPLAKYMELLSHWFGKLKITNNDPARGTSNAANARAIAKSASTSCSLPETSRNSRTKIPRAFSAGFASPCARWRC